MRELDGVADEIRQHLTQARHVADDVARRARHDPQCQLEPPCPRRCTDQIGHVLQGDLEIERCFLEAQLTGLDLRIIEDVVDDEQQAVRGAAHGFGVVALRRGQRRVEQQLRHPDDAVQGGADLVAHAGQERGLGRGGAPRLLLARRQAAGDEQVLHQHRVQPAIDQPGEGSEHGNQEQREDVLALYPLGENGDRQRSHRGDEKQPERDGIRIDGGHRGRYQPREHGEEERPLRDGEIAGQQGHAGPPGDPGPNNQQPQPLDDGIRRCWATRHHPVADPPGRDGERERARPPHDERSGSGTPEEGDGCGAEDAVHEECRRLAAQQAVGERLGQVKAVGFAGHARKLGWEVLGVQRRFRTPSSSCPQTKRSDRVSVRPSNCPPRCARGRLLTYDRVTVYCPQAVKAIVTVICCVPVSFVRVTCTWSVPASNLGRTVHAAL